MLAHAAQRASEVLLQMVHSVQSVAGDSLWEGWVMVPLLVELHIRGVVKQRKPPEGASVASSYRQDKLCRVQRTQCG